MTIAGNAGFVWGDNREGWVETLVGQGLDLVSSGGNFNGCAMVQYVLG